MNLWENTVLTDQGKALQAKLMKGQTLKIKRVMTGAGKVPVVDLRQQTSVTEGGYDITLQPARTEGDSTILPVLLENKGLEKSYELWQVGFYAEDPDKGEILFCLAQASEAKNIPSEAESPGFSITWDFYFNTSNTVPFEVVLNSAGLVNIEAYQVHTEAIQKTNSRINSLNSALVNKFKVVTGTLLANSGGINLSYPSGYDKENCVVIDVAIKYNGQNWESGVGVHQQNNPQRLFASLNREEIYVHCETDTQYVLGQQCRVVLMKI